MTSMTTVEIMFQHAPSKIVTFCKVAFGKLNWKLRKLQKEGVFILGIYIKENEENTQLPLPLTYTKEERDVRQVGDAVEGTDCGDSESCGCADSNH